MKCILDLNLSNNLFNNFIKGNNIIKNFIKELNEELQNNSNKNNINLKDENIENMELTRNEEIEFNRKEFSFLQNYFQKELSDLSKGEIYIVTNKYETDNDDEYCRYKVTQYKDNLECKYIALKKDLPENVEIGNVVRKVNEIYIYDKQATQYVTSSIKEIKQNIINKRL